MSNNKHNSYTLEFKKSSAKLAVESDQPVSKIAEELGVNFNTIYTWIGIYGERKETKNMQQDEALKDELKRIKKELTRVIQE